MTTHAVIITYLRDQTQPAVDAIGGFYRTCVLTGKALVRRPFHWREAIEQGWFITSVSLLPTLAVSIPLLATTVKHQTEFDRTRAAGVEVGKVTLIDGDKQVLVDFTVDRSLSLDQATTASIRYLNLIGDRYLELGRGHSGQRLAPGATIPLEHTHPALDLDALLGGFRPLFQTLDPDKVNSIASSIITVFQGQGASRRGR